MKKVYEAPSAELFTFQTQDILAPSGGNPLIDGKENGGKTTEIGKIPLF